MKIKVLLGLSTAHKSTATANTAQPQCTGHVLQKKIHKHSWQQNSQNHRTINICTCLPESLKGRKNNSEKRLLSSVIFTQWKKTAQEKKCSQTARDKTEWLAGLALLLNKAEAMKLWGVHLGDQLKHFKLARAPNLVNCALFTIADEKKKAFSEAVDLYLNGKWKIGEDSSNDSDTKGDEEEFLGMNDDGDWTDEDWNCNLYHIFRFSVVQARLGLKTPTLARLSTAQASQNWSPSHQHSLGLAWARLGLRPQPGSWISSHWQCSPFLLVIVMNKLIITSTKKMYFLSNINRNCTVATKHIIEIIQPPKAGAWAQADSLPNVKPGP